MKLELNQDQEVDCIFIHRAMKDPPRMERYGVKYLEQSGEEGDGWPAYIYICVPPTISGNRVVLPHSIPGKGLSSVQLGGGGRLDSFYSHLPTF